MSKQNKICIKYSADYSKNEGVKLVLTKSKKKHYSKNEKKKHALRCIAKLMLKLFWGKSGQNLRKSKTSFFHESEADNFFQCISDLSKTIKETFWEGVSFRLLTNQGL